MLTQERLLELLDYDLVSGNFFWKINTRRSYKGDIAGCLDGLGRVIIGIDKKYYKAHRLAWLNQFGDFPEGYIDHIDRNPTNNSIFNLREATNSQNQANRLTPINNKSGHKGIRRNGRKYRVTIYFNNKPINVGSFDSYDLAVSTHDKKAKELFGEFHRAK